MSSKVKLPDGIIQERLVTTIRKLKLKLLREKFVLATYNEIIVTLKGKQPPDLNMMIVNEFYQVSLNQTKDKIISAKEQTIAAISELNKRINSLQDDLLTKDLILQQLQEQNRDENIQATEQYLKLRQENENLKKSRQQFNN